MTAVRPDDTAVSGAAMIAAERERQVSVEGWTAEHDDRHDGGEMACAAAVYALPSDLFPGAVMVSGVYVWPWENRWYKPVPKDRVRELVKAGALIAAEIDRLNRMSR